MSRSDTQTLERRQEHPVATTLRSRGFVPLPRLWVHTKDMPTIHLIAGQYREEVNAVRAEVGSGSQAAQGASVDNHGTPGQSDPRTDRDAAWEAVERLRRSG